MSEGLRYIPACVPEVICEAGSTSCTGSSKRLPTNATLEVPESHGHAAWNTERCMPLCTGLAGTVPAWKLEDWPARHCNRPDTTGQVLSLVLLWRRGRAVVERHVFGADGKNMSVPPEKCVSALTAQRRTTCLVLHLWLYKEYGIYGWYEIYWNIRVPKLSLLIKFWRSYCKNKVGAVFLPYMVYVKNLSSLHLLRTTSANSLKQQYNKRWYYFIAQWHFGSVL